MTVLSGCMQWLHAICRASLRISSTLRHKILDSLQFAVLCTKVDRGCIWTKARKRRYFLLKETKTAHCSINFALPFNAPSFLLTSSRNDSARRNNLNSLKKLSCGCFLEQCYALSHCNVKPSHSRNYTVDPILFYAEL